MVEWLFLAVPWGCLRFVIVVFPDHTHLLFWGMAVVELLVLTFINPFQYDGGKSSEYSGERS